jgi:hypothetical protein
MLSQRTMLYLSLHLQESGKEKSDLKQSILSNLDELVTANQKILSGTWDSNSNYEITAESKDLYHSLQLQSQIDLYQKLINLSLENNRLHPDLNISFVNELLLNLNNMVKYFEYEADQHFNKVKKNELVLLTLMMV